MQQPPRDETWIDIPFYLLKFDQMQVLLGEWLHISMYFQILFNLILIKH